MYKRVDNLRQYVAERSEYSEFLERVVRGGTNAGASAKYIASQLGIAPRSVHRIRARLRKRGEL